jgi:2-oxoglutarate dehydrogenase E2 component (dihydrolipoamide succinyltransferase)
MASVEMLMPKMGESIIEGTILTWLKKEGDSIEADESVLEVATDKVDTEVPATHGGILKKILAKEGDVVAVGAAIAIIEIPEVIEELIAWVKCLKRHTKRGTIRSVEHLREWT